MIFNFRLRIHNMSRLPHMRQLSFPVVVVVPNLMCVRRHLRFPLHALDPLLPFMLLLLERVITALRKAWVMRPFWMPSLLRRRTTARWWTIRHRHTFLPIVLFFLFELTVNFDADLLVTYLLRCDMRWVMVLQDDA